MKSSFGKNIIVTIDGGSHRESVGVTIEGLPKDISIDHDKLQRFLNRRAPGNSPYTTRRKEPDILHLLSTRPLRYCIYNEDYHSRPYHVTETIPRPGHADFTAYKKYDMDFPMAGGGPFSGRMTAPLCIAGGIALQLLEKKGVIVKAHLYQVGAVKDTSFSPTMTAFPEIAEDPFPVIAKQSADAMKNTIQEAISSKDSVGGVVEVAAIHVPTGLGGPMYQGVESVLSPIFFGIPAVKGVEFGAGFGSCTMKGSQNNDPFMIDASGNIVTVTNNHGGLLGGITSGMPIICRIGFKPTPSIGREQHSVNIETGTPATITLSGRHDPCVALRAVPVCEAAMAIGLLDLLMENQGEL